jgi:hypothetical protein
MKNIILLIFIIFCLNSCSNKKEEKVLSKSEKLTDSYFQADSELEFENEKITLISIMHGIPKDSVYLILRDYYAKNDLSFDIDSKSTENFIDTISKNRKMSKRKIASIIFSFKYEMQTKDEIEQDAIENYEDFKKDDRESEDEY